MFNLPKQKKENVLNLQFPFFILAGANLSYGRTGVSHIYFLFHLFPDILPLLFLLGGRKGWNPRRKEGGRELFMNNFVSLDPTLAFPFNLPPHLYFKNIFSLLSSFGRRWQFAISLLHSLPTSARVFEFFKPRLFFPCRHLWEKG